jgi:uncharacterized protein YaiI (UPF0178 family)
MTRIFVDADACPVKQEIYRVAARYGLDVILVANAWMRVPDDSRIKLELVDGGFDAADDWIASRIGSDDLLVTADIPLAGRSFRTGATVLSPTVRAFTSDNIGDILATRDLMSGLRSGGAVTGGPPPLQKRDRSRFLQSLDTAIQSIRRKHSGDPPPCLAV